MCYNIVLEEKEAYTVLKKKENGQQSSSTDLSNYLTCERSWVFELLMLCAGMMGAYTFVLRGGVFCNAQTANFVMMAAAFGQAKWSAGFYFLIPITAYFAGTIISEIAPNPVKRFGLLRWYTYLIGFEIIVLFIVGLMPLTVPNHIVQITINFIASMQYNTFRQAEGVPMATTFCTNHVRQFGIGIAKYIRKKDKTAFKKGIKHCKMIIFFFAGGTSVTILSNFVKEKSIWIALIPMLIIFAILTYADLGYERDKMHEKPKGH